uniref:Uncharacterized protein n=1 Tax=Glossina pallidipes TaxID=7398 RepID=A0A1A9ZY49_GLOPL
MILVSNVLKKSYFALNSSLHPVRRPSWECSENPGYSDKPLLTDIIVVGGGFAKREVRYMDVMHVTERRLLKILMHGLHGKCCDWKIFTNRRQRHHHNQDQVISNVGTRATLELRSLSRNNNEDLV